MDRHERSWCLFNYYGPADAWRNRREYYAVHDQLDQVALRQRRTQLHLTKRMHSPSSEMVQPTNLISILDDPPRAHRSLPKRDLPELLLDLCAQRNRLEYYDERNDQHRKRTRPTHAPKPRTDTSGCPHRYVLPCFPIPLPSVLPTSFFLSRDAFLIGASADTLHIALFDSHALFNAIIANPAEFLNGTAPLDVLTPISSCRYPVNANTSTTFPNCTEVTGTDRDSHLWYTSIFYFHID